MRIKSLGLAAAILIHALPAFSQEQLIKGVYARSVEQCAAAKKDLQAYIETGDTILTPRGLEGLEYNCEFLDWKMSKISPGAVATMLCEEPGYAYPEVYAIMQRGENELEFTQSISVPQGDQPGNYGMYYLCEGVAVPGR